ncbi:hypothetical protein BJV78DRAFT_1184301 [Lactifluus subvellereus]|nr:hypothetical protein BJV78DRAFT_1184301 [Lactifluus subvellereus]
MSLTCDYLNFGAPFDDWDVDLIIRSAPLIVPASVTLAGNRGIATDFRVHKLFLIKASPVFERLLGESSSPGPSNPSGDEASDLGIRRDNHDDLPVLCLSEDRDTLHRLLSAIYPTDVVYPQTLEAMMKTYAAARKYAMSSALALMRTYCNRVARIVTTENAFRAYLFAFNEGLKEEALEAAQLTLSQPQTFTAYGPDLCNASGPALKALWKHRQFAFVTIGFAVQECVAEVGDLRGWKTSLPRDKPCCAEVGSRPHEQFLLFTRKLTSNFASMNFPSFVEAMSALGGFKCSSCKAPIRLDLLRLFNCLEGHVNGKFKKMHGDLLSLFDNSEEAHTDLRPSDDQQRDFGAPFDRKDSDLIIRSYDKVDFHVHKAVLAIASVVFEDMFTAPGPSPPEQGEGTPVIDNLTEDSKTLHRLLTMLYPVDPSIPETFEDALSLLSACQKYQMDATAARVRTLLKERTPPLITAQNSFRAYGIASRYHLGEEALLAARLTLERMMNFYECGEDLAFISGADLFRLWQYRTECTKVARDCINQMKRYTTAAPSISRSCTGSTNLCKNDAEELQSVPRWWHTHFLQRAADRPSPRSVANRAAFERSLTAHKSASGCPSCPQPDDTRVDNSICVAVEARLSAAIERVDLDGTPSA